MIPSEIPGPAITLKQVTVSEGQQVLLDPISCRFEGGQWHAILGPNGSGKSSLLKTILGLKNHLGTIRIEWCSSVTNQASRQTPLGYLPQLVPFDASLPISVRDYLLMSLSSRPVYLDRELNGTAYNALQKVDLHDKLERRLGDLSGGERQRLMLVCALLQNPALLILDEPMSGLDADGREEIIALLEAFRDAGGTILMVEHDWSLVQAHCDYVHWLDRDIKASGPCTQFSEVLAPVAGYSLHRVEVPATVSTK
ncbi:MAG: metal ABC transporter ATP-binding protein [Pseudomonadota bacterium]